MQQASSEEKSPYQRAVKKFIDNVKVGVLSIKKPILLKADYHIT